MQDYSTYDQGSALLFQLLPLLIWQLVFVVITFIVCRKRRVNPWGWTIGTLIPMVGVFVYGVFSLVTWLSMLNRLNALEGKSGRS